MSAQRITCAAVGLALALGTLPAVADYELRSLSGPRADIAALILAGRESGALVVAGLATASCAGSSTASPETTSAEVRLDLEIQGRSLLDAVASGNESEVPESVRVELFVYAMTRAGEIAASLSKWVRLPLTDLADRSPGGGVKLVERLELPPGEYQIRVLVRDARSQQFALRVLEVVVPDGGDSRPAMTPPLFSQDETPWLIAAGKPAPGETISVLPVLVPGEPRPLRLQGCHLTDGEFHFRLLGREEKPVPGVRVRVDPVVEDAARHNVTAEIELGETEAGLYLLEARVQTASGESTRSLPVFVTPAAGVSTWTALSGLTGEPEVQDDDLDLETASGSSRRIKAIETAYLKSLDLLASGRVGPAVAALEKLEREVFEAHDAPRKALKWLTEAQNRVTRELLRHDPECLLPLLVLHLELQSRYVAAGDVSSYLVNATRTRIRSLAEVYATDAKQEMAPALAAMSLVELATVLEKSGRLISALVVLREAAALDRSNTDIILGLAYQYEHHRFRQEALDLLGRLVELDPRSDEGRLRLAINLFHLERSTEAVALLDQLISNATTEWVLAIAYQEQAHFLLRRERFDEAARLLEEAVRRLPDIQRLRIELAYALDRSGQRKRGREIVAELPADGGQASPRLLYRVPDRGAGLRSRAELRRHGMARLPLLAAALGESGAAG